MCYKYLEEKQKLFTEQGQVIFLRVRDNVQRLLRESGAFNVAKAVADLGGDSWFLLACIDRLEELGEIVEMFRSDQKPMKSQYRTFIGAHYDT